MAQFFRTDRPARRLPEVAPLTSRDPDRVGAFTLVGRLGSGGAGTVYAALGHDEQLFAVRVFHPVFAEDPGFRARLSAEAGLVRQADGPFLARLFTVAPEEEPPWVATELVSGPSLERWLGARGPLAGPVLTALAAGTLAALCSLHARGAVHRDLRPGNVLLADEGPKVLDAGIARALDENVLRRTGGLAGGSAWTAPERFREGVSTPGADVFAWGALMVVAATGRPPFGTGTPQEVAARVLWEEPDLTGVPTGLLPLVESALTKDPERRPGAAELLHRLLGAGSTAAGVVGRGWRGFEVNPVPRRRRGRKLVVAALTGVLLALLTAGALLL